MDSLDKTDSFLNKLTMGRDSLVKEKNIEFYLAIDEILQEEFEKINYTNLENILIQQIRENIATSNVSTIIELNIDKLFKEYDKNLFVFVFKNSIDEVCKYTFAKHKSPHSSSNKYIYNTIYLQDFIEYLYTKQPKLQKIRSDIQSHFPKAKLTPTIIADREPFIIRIEISYNLNNITVLDRSNKPIRDNKLGTVAW